MINDVVFWVLWACVITAMMIVICWMISLSNDRTAHRRMVWQQLAAEQAEQKLYEERPIYRTADDTQVSLFILVSMAEWYLEKGYWTCSKCGFASNPRTHMTCRTCDAPWWQRESKPPTFTI